MPLKESSLLLKELRKEFGVNQETMADLLNVDRPRVSRLENRDDHLISTLRAYVEALGGKLEITAVVKGKRKKLRGV